MPTAPSRYTSTSTPLGASRYEVSLLVREESAGRRVDKWGLLGAGEDHWMKVILAEREGAGERFRMDVTPPSAPDSAPPPSPCTARDRRLSRHPRESLRRRG